MLYPEFCPWNIIKFLLSNFIEKIETLNMFYFQRVKTKKNQFNSLVNKVIHCVIETNSYDNALDVPVSLHYYNILAFSKKLLLFHSSFLQLSTLLYYIALLLCLYFTKSLFKLLFGFIYFIILIQL